MRRVGVAVAVLVAAYAVFAVWWFGFAGTGTPHRADAIIVLSGDRGRVPTALRLYDEHLAPTLVVSRDPYPWPELDARCHGGIVCIHAHPYSTQGEAEAFARLARARGWHSVIIVSSRYHLRRAAMLFRRCTDASIQVAAAPTGLWGWARNVVFETAKLLYHVTVDRGC